MCVTSLLCGPRADLWPFYGFLCKRLSLYIHSFFYKNIVFPDRAEYSYFSADFRL